MNKEIFEIAKDYIKKTGQYKTFKESMIAGISTVEVNVSTGASKSIVEVMIKDFKSKYQTEFKRIEKDKDVYYFDIKKNSQALTEFKDELKSKLIAYK